MKKPIIGIVSKNITIEDFYGWQWQRICDSVRYALVKNDAIVIGILPQRNSQRFSLEDEHEEIEIDKEEIKMLETTLKLCDGIILQGGISSNNYEEYIAKYCYEKDIPCMGICAGFNNMIRALGGTTKNLESIDIHDRPDLKYAHSCKVIDKNSRFYQIVRQEKFEVNSVHTYIADKVPDCLKVVAKSGDGQVEVIENSSKKFFIGIKYHPELLVDYDEKQNRIFEEFVYTCKN